MPLILHKDLQDPLGGGAVSEMSSGIFLDERSHTQWPGTLEKLDLSSAVRQPLFHAMLGSVVCLSAASTASQPQQQPMAEKETQT